MLSPVIHLVKPESKKELGYNVFRNPKAQGVFVHNGLSVFRQHRVEKLCGHHGLDNALQEAISPDFHSA